MEQKSTKIVIAEYFDIVRRGKYFLLVPIIVSVIIGCAVAFKLPPIYRSEVKLYYIEAQIPEWAQLQTVNIYLEAMIVFVEALAFSRDNSLRIITDLDLYPDLIGNIPADDVIVHLRDNYSKKPIYTAVPGQQGKTQEVITGFEFMFNHRDPQKAFQVANVLASKFIEYYKQFRAALSRDTSSFFDDERKRLKEEIVLIDQKISVFKKEHVEALPELFQMNYRTIDVLNTKLLSLDQELLRLRGQKKNIETSLVTINPFLPMEGISGARIVTAEERLAALTAELELLLTTYSEKHPDVIRAREEITLLQDLVDERQTGRGEEETPEAADNATGRMVDPTSLDYLMNMNQEFLGAYNPIYVQFLVQLNELKIEIDTIKDEKAKIEEQILEYEQRLGRTPFVEKEYNALMRDLQSAQQRYNELSTQVLTLESSAAMEKREMGGKLTIGQPPTFPLRPFKPNRTLIIAGSFFAGIGIGIALLLGWEFFTKTVRMPEDVEYHFKLPVLVELPTVTLPKKKIPKISFKMVRRIIAVLIVIIVLVAIDRFYIEIDVLVAKIIMILKRRLLLSGF